MSDEIDYIEVFSEEHADLLLKKLEAETAKITWETEEIASSNELRAAEIRKTIADALTAEHQAEVQRIYRDERKRAEDLAVIADHYVYQHYFNGPVDERSVFNALNSLAAWDRRHPECPMNITINSPGGSVIDGMHLFDQLSAHSLRGGGKHKVTITVRGYAASMAGILLQAADERVIGPESYLMIHEVSSFAAGKIGELKDEIKFLDRISERVANIFVDRSRGRTTMESFIHNWERKDWWLDSQQALDNGFVDRIG